MSAPTVPRQTLPALPCHVGDPDLWFAETPTDLERAKTLCADLPVAAPVPGGGAGAGRTLGSMGR